MLKALQKGIKAAAVGRPAVKVEIVTRNQYRAIYGKCELQDVDNYCVNDLALEGGMYAEILITSLDKNKNVMLGVLAEKIRNIGLFPAFWWPDKDGTMIYQYFVDTYYFRMVENKINRHCDVRKIVIDDVLMEVDRK